MIDNILKQIQGRTIADPAQKDGAFYINLKRGGPQRQLTAFDALSSCSLFYCSLVSMPLELDCRILSTASSKAKS
jgi:hypothetical protein